MVSQLPYVLATIAWCILCLLNCPDAAKPIASGEELPPAAVAGEENNDAGGDVVPLEEREPQRNVELGQPCSIAETCVAAYSQCRLGKCKCLPGMKRTGRTCQPEVRSCPFGGEPHVIEGVLTKCNPNPPDDTDKSAEDEALANGKAAAQSQNRTSARCPKHFFCLSEKGDEDSTHNSVGFCCPRPTACPIGVPLSNVTCSGDSGDDGDVSENAEYCPTETHYCYSVSVSQGNSHTAELCCPNPCPSGTNFRVCKLDFTRGEFQGAYVRDGICYEPLKVGQACNFTEQCEENEGVCLDGKCACPKDKVATSYGSCQAPSCVRTTFDKRPAPQPAKDDGGNILICPERKCPSATYCTAEQNICCPIPEPYCTDTSTHVSPNDQCDANIPAEGSRQCGSGKTCKHWYSVASRAATASVSAAPPINIGLCCP